MLVKTDIAKQVELPMTPRVKIRRTNAGCVRDKEKEKSWIQIGYGLTPAAPMPH